MGRDQYKEALCVAVAAARITPMGTSEARALTPVEEVAAQARKLVCQKKVLLQSQEPRSSVSEALLQHAKKVKLSTVLDQTEETEVPVLTPAVVF